MTKFIPKITQPWCIDIFIELKNWVLSRRLLLFDFNCSWVWVFRLTGSQTLNYFQWTNQNSRLINNIRFTQENGLKFSNFQRFNKFLKLMFRFEIMNRFEIFILKNSETSRPLYFFLQVRKLKLTGIQYLIFFGKHIMRFRQRYLILSFNLVINFFLVLLNLFSFNFQIL